MTREQQKAGLLKIIEDFNAEGMTGAKDPGIGEMKWELYRELLQEGKLTVRVFALWSGARRLEDAPRGAGARPEAARGRRLAGDGMLISGGVKMYMDGSGGARTAWMHDEWNKDFTGRDTGNTGYPSTPPDAVSRNRHRACMTPAFTSARTPSAIGPSIGWWIPTIRC